MSEKCTTWSNQKEKQDLVKYEMQKYALAVKAEETSVEYHAERSLYADKILTGEANIFEFCLAITTNTTIKGQIEADQDCTSDLAYCTGQIFNAFAGIN